MDRSPYTDRDRIRRLARDAGLDAVVATSPPNVTHASGYYNLDQRLLGSEFLHACVWPVDGEPALLLPALERRLETFVADVRVYPAYGAGSDSAEAQLARIVSERGLARGRIGVDMRELPASSHHRLVELLPHAALVDAGELFGRMRAMKTAAEVELLRRAAAATDKAIAVGYRQASRGDTEKDIVDVMDYHTLKYGAETVAFNIIASGPRTLQGHHRAERVPIASGDVLRVDYGGLFDGYFTDLARMAVVGPASPRQRSIYERCREVQLRFVEACRPGVTGAELYELACRLYESAGLTLTRTMFGHSIGLHVHERPFFAANEPLVLEPNMVVCVENGWNDVEHRERYHIEDMVLVTSGEPEVLSDGPARADMISI